MLTTGTALALLAIHAQSPRRLPAEDSVVVSRRALTLSFGLDSAILRGKATGQPPGFGVDLMLDVPALSSRMRLRIVAPVDSVAYRSPRAPLSCRALTDTYACGDSTFIEIVNDRLTITVRDSAKIELLFASHPARVWLRSDFAHTSLRMVRYDGPPLLPPSKAALADYDLALAREGWSGWNRDILTASFQAMDPVWMQVGESTDVFVREMQGRAIDGYNSRSDFSASGWTSSDSSVVALGASGENGVSMNVHALRPGSATVAVHGLHGPSDDMPRSTRIRNLESHVIVTRRLARIAITPRPATIVAGSKMQLAAHVIDETGAVVREAPLHFFVIYDSPQQYGGWEGRRYEMAERADLTTPGHRRFIAYFRNLADTLDVQVVPRAAPPRY